MFGDAWRSDDQGCRVCVPRLWVWEGYCRARRGADREMDGWDSEAHTVPAGASSKIQVSITVLICNDTHMSRLMKEQCSSSTRCSLICILEITA